MLAVYIQNGSIRFGSFDEGEQEVKEADGELPFSELEGSWNWVYLGLNLKEGKVLASQYNIDNKIWEFLTIEETFKDDPLSYLKFIVGKSFGVPTINGHFFDIRFDFFEGSLIENAKDLKRYFKKVIPLPTALNGSDELVNKEVELNGATNKEKSFSADYASETVTATDFTEDLQHNKEYAVYGWFKFEEPKIRRDFHTVFRLTSNSPDANFGFPGDSTLSLYVTPSTLEFVTYTINDNWVGEDNTHLSIDVDFDNDLYAWIFIYFAYERNSKTYNLYVRFQDRNERIIGNAIHFVPKTFKIYLGEDGHNDPFNG